MVGARVAAPADQPFVGPQARGSLGRAQVWRDAGSELRAYARRSVVKASFSRNRKSGAWTAHAGYLSRPGAQQELAKGLGFDATREGIDLQATVRDWEKSDKLMWRFIVSPEDADRLSLRDHVREQRGLLPGRLRSIAVCLRLSRAHRRRFGVSLGVWRRFGGSSHIRDCGAARVLVFAPTRSGKGVGVVIPTLLTWPHSVLVHDLKSENWALTAGARRRMGQVCLKFAPASAEEGNARYNPLAEVRLRTPHEIRDVRNIVQMILDPEGKGLPDHWSREGSAFLTGMILDQLYQGREKTLSGLEARLCDPAQPIDDSMQQIMRAEHDPAGAMNWTDSNGAATTTHPIIARAMRSMLDKSFNERSGAISEVKGFLELYRDPVIAANTAV